MRALSTLTIVLLALCGTACAQTCTGNATTSISGTVYAPNGTDPLPNVTVYVPNAPVAAFTPGVSCPVVGTPPSGVDLGATPAAVGTTTAVDGTFTLPNVPVGSSVPIVAVSGKWRVQGTVDTSGAACGNTVHNLTMPQDHTQGDIPLIAIATGSADQVECVLLKMGISQSEFTDPGGGGQINLFGGGGAAGSGVTLDAATPTQASLMGSSSMLNNYDVLMLPCEGSDYTKPDAELQNLIAFADGGGRVYSSHYSYSWMWQNPPFDGVANWLGNSGINSLSPDPGVATVNTGFTAGQTLEQWLQLPAIDASQSPGQMVLDTLRQDANGVVPPTQSWLTLNDPAAGNPVMQFVFDTPIQPAGTTTPVNQCGRVLYNEYHVENPTGGSGSVRSGTVFPNECDVGAAMTPQEKLLEYMLFELTGEGGQPTLAPTTLDFGPEAVSYPSAAQSFTWTNNSSFALQVTSATIGGTNAGDFAIASAPCGTVAGGASCTITVVFTPAALGTRAGTLTVTSSGSPLTATLTGTGTPGFTLSPAFLSFGNQDVGFSSAPRTLTLTSLASGPLALPPFAVTGEYSIGTAACGSMLAAGASCPVAVAFLPTTTGPLGGTVGVSSTSLLYSGLNATLSGNGVDFTLILDPASGTVVAGDATATTATLTPLAGFNASLSLTCTVAPGATASSCTPTPATVLPSAAVTSAVGVTTTSRYTVVGYGGFGGGYMWLVGVGSGWLLWRKRRSGRALLRGGLLAVLLGAMGLGLTSCTGKLPNQNATWTGPGNYSVTVTATDGSLVHSATYSLTVTAQ